MAADLPAERRCRAFARLVLAAACLAAVAGHARPVAAGARPSPAAGQAPEAGGEPDAAAFAERVAAAWNAGDVDGWLGLWSFATPAARAEEEVLARGAFAADETTLTFLRTPRAAGEATRVTLEAQVFVTVEPRGRVAYWILLAERRDGRWTLVERQDGGQVDGLVHLSLDPTAFRVRDASLKLEDFELRMESGTLFQTAATIGPTGLVFVGRGRVVFTPRPPAEREQLRQYSGHPTLDVAVSWAFARLHPADFARFVDTAHLEPEPAPAGRRAEAERRFRERTPRSFALDAPLPRSPWWLLPAVGDAVVDFPRGRRRVLTFAVSSGESEDLNLFDRDRHLQICVYPSRGRPEQYDDDSRRSIDVLEQDLTVRFEPDRLTLSGVHRMKLVMLQPAPTLRLRLDDDLHVSSITNEDGTSLLSFRVREQNSIVVSLGSLAGREDPFTLVTRYSGRHDPTPVDQEVLQATTVRERDEDTFIDRPPLVYSSRTAWYPRPPTEDFAPVTVGLDTPEGWLAVTGGELTSLKTEGRRTRTEWRSVRPGKFLTAVVGRLTEVGMRQEGGVAVRGFATARSRGEATAAMPLVQRIVTFYARLFGPCPYPSLDVVIAEAETPGGHSPPGLVYLQQRPPVLRLRSLPDDPANFSDLPGFFAAHEVAHQWWGQGTAPSSYRERWLSEAWAQYASALWVRESLGEDAFRGMMERMGRWAFRDDDAGPIHLGQRLGLIAGDPRIFRSVVYDKGAWVLHMLRGLIGDDAFFGGARAFLDSHRYAKADTEDLREALEKASGRDLRAYFERWVYATGLPRLTFATHTEPAEAGGFRTRVDVKADALPGEMPLEVTLVGSSGRETRRVALGPTGGSFSFDTRERPRRVLLNEDHGLLARVETGRAQR